MWPDCSPPSTAPERLHLLEHVAVADLGLDDGDAALAHGDLEAEVAHHRGRRPCRAAACPRSCQVRGADRHDLVAVDLVAGLVDREHAVGVAVVRDAEVERRRSRTSSR